MTPLADITALENHLQKTFTTPEGQTQANQALELASGAVRAYCGWVISRQIETFEDYGDGSRILSLPTLHLVDVLRINVDGTDLDLATVVKTLKGQLYRADGWPKECVVVVDAEHGFDPVPDLIRLVTLDLAGRQIQNPEGLVSATTGEVTRVWSNSVAAKPNMTVLHQTLLDRYRVF